MSSQPTCPRCQSEFVYSDGPLWTCPECSHEWSLESKNSAASDGDSESTGIVEVKDANGNILKDGDSVTIIKDLKVKGSASSIKVGTKVKRIRLIEEENGHNISCNIEGFGSMNLKSEFVKKV